MRTELEPRGFWDRGRCEYCGGAIREKTTEITRKIKGKHVLVENVPTGVCSECGTRYYSANVLKTIEETLSGRRKARREERVPVYSL
jgi:YgiT-type zinc finger domain-containing protein